MPEPQPGARPADGRTPGPELDDAPAVADESTSPPVPPDQPATPGPAGDPRPSPPPGPQPEPTAQEPAAQPEPTAQETRRPSPSRRPRNRRPNRQRPPGVRGPARPHSPGAQGPGGADGPGQVGGSPAAPTVVPAPPLERVRARSLRRCRAGRAWGESAEPTPPPPLPRGSRPSTARLSIPGPGWSTGGWDLPLRRTAPAASDEAVTTRRPRRHGSGPGLPHRRSERTRPRRRRPPGSARLSDVARLPGTDLPGAAGPPGAAGTSPPSGLSTDAAHPRRPPAGAEAAPGPPVRHAAAWRPCRAGRPPRGTCRCRCADVAAGRGSCCSPWPAAVAAPPTTGSRSRPSTRSRPHFPRRWTT